MLVAALDLVGDFSRFGGGHGGFMLQWVFMRVSVLLDRSLYEFITGFCNFLFV